MLIKDKDILVQDQMPLEAAADKPAPVPTGISKEHMSEAWGDAFDYYLRGITTKYLQFGGRATRLEFWGFAVVSSLLYIPLYALGQFADVLLLPYYYALATLVPSFAVMARRLHDINKRSMVYLVITAALLALMFLFPAYAALPFVIWVGVMVRLLSRPTDSEEGLYGEPNADDEIYGSDNEPIIGKFRLLALLMSGIWLLMTSVWFDDWSRQAEQKGTIEQILEEVDTEAQKAHLSASESAAARNVLLQMLRKLDGQAISKEKKQEMILEAVKQVKSAAE